MMRLVATIVMELIANAVGLIVAAWLLPGFSINVVGFIIVLAIFTVVKFIAGPLMLKMSLQYMQQFSGGVALLTTLVGLFVTTLLTDGLVITGITTWILATLIVWLFGVFAAIVLPLFLFKKVLSDARGASEK
jgi:putative membrane protein